MSSCLDRHSYQIANIALACRDATLRVRWLTELLHADQRHSHSRAVLKKKVFADIKTSGCLYFIHHRDLAEYFPSIFLMSLHSVSDQSGMKIKDSHSAADDDDEFSPTCFQLDFGASAEES